MATEKRVTVKEITGKALSFGLIMLDNSVTGLRVETDDGNYTVERGESYGKDLRVWRDYQPKREPCWRVEAKFNDKSTSVRTFTGKKGESEAKYESEVLEGKSDCVEVKIIKGTVAVDEDGETIAGSTADDIPF